MGANVFMMSDEFVNPPIFPIFSAAEAHTPRYRLAHAPLMQETLFPTSHKLLSPVHVQPVVDKYIALTYQYLEERENQYNGLNVPLRDFIVPLTFDASGHAFFGKDCPISDLFKPFKLFDNNFHLFLAGVPKMFMKGPVDALEELVTIIEERYLSKPDALDDASDMIKEYGRIIREGGFVSRPSFTHTTCSHADGPLSRTPEMPLGSSPLSSGPSKRIHRSQHTGLSRSTFNDRMVSNHWSPRLTRLSRAGTPRTHPFL